MMKSKRWLTFGLIAVVMAGVLLLSGCVTIRSETVINSDLSGTRSVIMAMDQSMMEMAAQETGGEDPFAEIEGEFADVPGATVVPYTDPTTGNEGVKISIPFTDLDDLATQKFSAEEEDALDTVTWSQDGSVYTINFAVNTGDIAAGAQGQDAGEMTEEDKQMAAQMMATMGLEMSYSIALPGKILEYSPTEGATYNADNNEIIWKLDLTTAAMPNIMVKWDNSQAPAAIEAPAAEKPAEGMTMAAPQTMVAEVQAYANSIMSQDRDAYVALMAGGEMIAHPLMSDSPELFQASNYQVVYDNYFADDTMGGAEWTGTWTVNGSTYTLDGIDVLTFDASGKITAIESYVVPSEFVDLEAAVQ